MCDVTAFVQLDHIFVYVFSIHTVAHYNVHICLQVFAHHRQLEQTWHRGKVKLHQRLALRLFQQDVKQVINYS